MPIFYAYILLGEICIWLGCPHINTVTEAIQSGKPIVMPLRGGWGNRLGTCFVSIGRRRGITEVWCVPEHRLCGPLCSRFLLSSTGLAEGPIPQRGCAAVL